MKSLGLIVDQRKGGAGACLGAGRVHRATCGWNLRFFSPCNGSTPEEDTLQTSGGRVWRSPNCFDVSRPAAVPGGARHTWGAVQLGRHRSSSRPAIVSTQPSPLTPPKHPKPGKFGNKTGTAVPSRVLISGDSMYANCRCNCNRICI